MILVTIATMLLLFASDVAAQQSRVHVGGALTGVYQTQSEDDHVGGLAWGGSVLFGVQVSPRVAIEFEPSFGGAYSWEYTYRPGPSRTADVVASRRDPFFSFQMRHRAGVLEPVAGVSYVLGRISRHATSGGRPYFDDARSQNSLALVGGLDAGIELTPHVFLVPTARVYYVVRPGTADPFNDPLSEQTSIGPFTFRFGAGARVTF